MYTLFLHNFKNFMRFFIVLIGIFCFLNSAHASLPGQMNLKNGYQLYVLSTRDPNLWAEYDKIYYKENELKLNIEDISKIPEGMIERKKIQGVDRAYIANFLRKHVEPKTNKSAQGARVFVEDGKVKFEGVIERGEMLNLPLSIKIIEKALKENIDEIDLAVDIISPILDISPELLEMGIKEIISVGESDFTTSSNNRIHNIKTASSLFHGAIIKKDEDFSFNKLLGRVDGDTGYKKELVIKGDETPLEWGGGICQVSSTTYRGAMLAGLPIIERGSHSYAVSYYTPWGSDATVYPGSHDLRFKNDSQGAILIHTHMKETKLYFTFLGTKNSNKVDIFGPYINNTIKAPPTRYKPSKTLAEGQKLLVSPAHNGFTSIWFRIVDGVIQKIQSKYQSRPSIYKVGGLSETKIGALE